MKNLKTQGFILIDVDVVALNNAGKNTQSNFDNAVAVSYTHLDVYKRQFNWENAIQNNFKYR